MVAVERTRPRCNHRLPPEHRVLSLGGLSLHLLVLFLGPLPPPDLALHPLYAALHVGHGSRTGKKPALVPRVYNDLASSAQVSHVGSLCGLGGLDGLHALRGRYQGSTLRHVRDGTIFDGGERGEGGGVGRGRCKNHGAYGSGRELRGWIGRGGGVEQVRMRLVWTDSVREQTAERREAERTDFEEISVYADAREHQGEAPLQVGHFPSNGLMLGRRVRGCGPVENLLDAQEAGLEEGYGEEGRLVQRMVHLGVGAGSGLKLAVIGLHRAAPSDLPSRGQTGQGATIVKVQ